MSLFAGIRARLSKEYLGLIIVLLIALIHGLLYLALVPPWQHYDEPGHFEFAWLMGNRETPITARTFDQRMRRELAASMIEYDFFSEINAKPNLLSQNKEIWIGVSQINNRSLYYLLAGIPLRFIKTSEITFQLYIARSFSLLISLLCVLSAWGIAREVTPESHPLRWMLPISIALLPGFVDIMSSVNDDVGAAAFFSLFLWSGVRIIVRGFNWNRFVALIFLATLCFWAKNTVTIAVPIVLIPIVFSLVRGSARRIAFGALAVGALLLALNVIRWGDAAYWIRYSFPDLPTRQNGPLSPLGNNIFRMPVTQDHSSPRLMQVIPEPIERELRGEKVTLGSWIWSSKPGKVRTPLIVTEKGTYYEDVEVGEDPTFFAFSANIDPDNSKMNIVLSPRKTSMEELQVFYDGIVLAEGKRPAKRAPTFDDPNGLRGQWGNQPFTNLLRNGSAEKGWPWIRNWSDRLFSENFPGRLSLILAFLIDPGTAAKYYQAAMERIFQSFWVGFGWGQIELVGSKSLLFLGLIAVLGVAGAFIAVIRHYRSIPWEIVAFLGSAALFIWGSAIVRGTNSIADGQFLLPVARYTYPAIIPVMMFLNLGWLELIQLVETKTKIPNNVKYGSFLLIITALGTLGLLTILTFYGK